MCAYVLICNTSKIHLAWIVRKSLHIVGVYYILIDLILAQIPQLIWIEAGKVFPLSFHGEDHGTSLEVERIPVHAEIKVICTL